ncbi:MAG TPA: hypothetical protein VHO03_17060 [Ignavibacteriales bacterium]|nr:hypothetical protein [Ignavibacteriales bacterium]
MKIKVENLTKIYSSLLKLFNQDIDVTLAFQYMDSVKVIKEKFNTFTQLQKRIAGKYGKPYKEDGRVMYSTTPENKLLYEAEIEPLLQEEFEVNWNPIPLSKLDGILIGMEDAINLKDFIDKTK